MHVGWMTLGEGLPLDPTSNYNDEIINNTRTLVYAETLGLGWLRDCLECSAANDTNLVGTTYVDVRSDPAPWWNAAIPDRAGFAGVFGIEITGAEDSTRTASTTQSLGLGGNIGPSYSAPREMVLRALAVADSESALQEGFNWWKAQTTVRGQPAAGGPPNTRCRGDTLTYFHSCPPMTCREFEADPCPCDDMTTPGGPCWPVTYAELRDGPSCSPDWWPSTYAELKAGPPDGTDWCHWVYQYYELRLGADKWTCGSEACVVPYLWQFYNAAVTDGPKVLDHRSLTTGVFLEFEMTITAANPIPRRLLGHPL